MQQCIVVFLLLAGGLLVPSANASRHDVSLDPADLDPYITCPLTNDDSATLQIAGLPLEYRSSEEVDYLSRDWEARVAASWDMLGEELIGAEGINIDNHKETPDSVSDNARLVVIDIRRYQDQWVYHYLSNGTAFRPIEHWSSTKILAIFLAGLKIRHASEGRLGLDSRVGKTPLSELVNDIARASNNAPPAWFKTIMGAQAMTDYLNQWILKSDYDYHLEEPTISEVFLGRFGVPPLSLGGTDTKFEGPDGETVTIRRNLEFARDNTLSPLTLAESWKRIIAHQVDSVTRPRLEETELTDDDLGMLLYGHTGEQAQPSAGLLLGGTKDWLVEAIGGQALLDSKTGGKWRIFGKTGSGFSGYRKRNEYTFLGAACFPASEGGLEKTRAFVFSVNVQAKSHERVYQLRGIVIGNLFRLMVPELYAP